MAKEQSKTANYIKDDGERNSEEGNSLSNLPVTRANYRLN